MRSVQFSSQGVHRPVSIDTLDVLDAFDLTGLDVLDAIKRGLGANGGVIGAPDFMQSVTVSQ